jgi:HSP20 family protein
MAMERWDPFGEVSRFRDLFDRMVGEGWPRYWRSSQIGSNVLMDICDFDDEILVRAAIPGCRPEDLDITVKEDILTIRGEIKAPDYIRWEPVSGQSGSQTPSSGQQPGQPQQPQQPISRSSRGRAECWVQEISYGRFARSVTLPVSVNAGGARAEFQNGMLMLHIPKAEETKPRRIEVKSMPAEIPPTTSR